MIVRHGLFALAGLLGTACVTVPTGPSVMVLPGSRTSFEQFQSDDGACRAWAAQQTGTSTNQAATDAGVAAAAVGTAVGAVAGTAIGAAAGNVGAGAAIAAGSGLLLGTAEGTGRAAGSAYEVQHRYDVAYMQCMYAKGNQIPVARSAHEDGTRSSEHPPQPTHHRPPPNPSRRSSPPPPPPAGPPPPPPPDA